MEHRDTVKKSLYTGQLGLCSQLILIYATGEEWNTLYNRNPLYRENLGFYDKILCAQPMG